MAIVNVNQANASETVKGIVEEATQVQLNAGTDTGETGAKLFAPPSKILSLLGGYIASGATAGGELSGTYPNPAVLNSAILAKVLTGLNITGSSISATDTLLQAFGKIQNQLNGVLGGAIYQGVWNATTNSPSLASGAGTKGFYYVVSVAGSTNLDGVTDWKIGDWAIFNGTVWEKVDNTDAVSSVNGFLGAVNLTTDDIPEVTNLYFTTTRVLLTVLTGFTVGANSTILATDTLAQALEKVQGQINARPNENATTIAAINHAAAEKTDLVDADEVTGQDSASSFSLIRTTWANVRKLFRAPSVQSVASSATVTPAATDDLVIITAQAANLTLANPSGTSAQGRALLIRIKDNGTARTITYGSEYRAIGITLPTTTVISKTVYLGLIRNDTDTKWDCIGVSQQA